jgi:DNA repair exonuclease SbcCD ATPase subunit
VTDGAIAEIAEKFKDAEAKTPDGYRNVVTGIRCTRELRVEIETRRKELKADAIAYGRKVDGEAKRITQALLDVETPLKLLKEVVDNEKARIKRAAEKKRLAEEREKLEAERAEEKAQEKLLREIEEARLAEERKKLEEERAKFEAERQTAEKRAFAVEVKIQQEKLDREHEATAKFEAEEHERQTRLDKEQQERDARLEEEREKRLAEDRERAENQRIEDEDREHRRRELEALEHERQAREKAEKEAEQKRLEDERRKTELAELEKRRLAALPDVEKLKVYMAALLITKDPLVTSPLGIAVLGQINRKLLEAGAIVEDFMKELES